MQNPLRNFIGTAFLLSAVTSAAWAGTVSGRVVTEDGRPVPNVNVRADNTVFRRSFLPTVTDANGRYSIKLDGAPSGAWELRAEMKREYNGEFYSIRLRPDNLNPLLSNENSTRDFTWRLAGRNAQGDELGQWVYIHPDSMEAKDVEIVFTPEGPLVDGSAGKPIVATFAKMPLKIFPLGRYRLKARHLPTGEPLLIRPRGEEKASATPVVMFPASPMDKTPEQLDMDILRSR